MSQFSSGKHEKLSGELWAEVAPGYLVSNMGRVRGKSGRLLSPSPNNQGYLTYSVGRAPHKVHADVARFHVPGWFEGAVVRHLNGDQKDNRAANLAWGTPSENNLDMLAHGTNRNANKTHCPAGHEYTPENTRARISRRHCRTCDREAQRRYREKNREAILARRRVRERETRPSRSKSAVLTRLANLTKDES